MSHASTNSDADVVIAGAGCAGLSALWHVLHSEKRHQRIIVVDRRVDCFDDRTWSFWGPPSAPFVELSDQSWRRMRVGFPGYETIQPIGRSKRRAASNRAYYRVRSRDYSAAILHEAAKHSNVEIVEADISAITQRGRGVVSTSVGEMSAPVVFQSVRLEPTDRDAPVRHPLRQHFGGWEVRTDRPVFDPACVTLMDFDAPQHDGTAFFYVLPSSPHRALVEYTMFSEHPRPRAFYDDHVRGRLATLGADGYTIERSEYGVIPMEDRRHQHRSGEHVWNIGTVGGMTKPTTGYTFQRTHQQVRHLVNTWVGDGRPRMAEKAAARYGFADRTLLNILHQHPELGRPVFERLFGSSSIDDVLTFLDERSTLLADGRMVAGLPKKPFLRAAADEVRSDARGHAPVRLQWS